MNLDPGYGRNSTAILSVEGNVVAPALVNVMVTVRVLPGYMRSFLEKVCDPLVASICDVMSIPVEVILICHEAGKPVTVVLSSGIKSITALLFCRFRVKLKLPLVLVHAFIATGLASAL